MPGSSPDGLDKRFRRLGLRSVDDLLLHLPLRYWTSRGIAVVDVDYRGSSGYGREYRKLLDGQWGIAEERSVSSVLSHNLARKNGDAGLFVANTVDTEEGARDAGETRIRHNRTEGNRVGVTVRRLRNLSVDRATTSSPSGSRLWASNVTSPSVTSTISYHSVTGPTPSTSVVPR